MFKKPIFLITFITMIFAVVASAYIPNLNEELQRNTELIKQYKEGIKSLEERNKLLKAEKAKNPKLYEEKPSFEDTKDAYIYRIKLGGAEAKNVNMTIKDHYLSIEMNIKVEEKTQNAYYASSRYFFQSYAIPKNVKEDEIKHSVEGDYFVITMPKK
jgi:HSP20 family molecular chaperone IbpA